MSGKKKSSDPIENAIASLEERVSVLGRAVAAVDLLRTGDEGINASQVSLGLAVTEVDDASEAFEKGLRAGDVIVEAGQQKVGTVAELEARVEDARAAGRKSLLLLGRRAGDPRFVALSRVS